MDAILYICHGSRVQAAVHSAIHFVNQVQSQVNCQIQEISFIELASPSIWEGLHACVKQGAKTIYVLPVLLLSANHAKIDIPNEIVIFQKQFPSIQIKLGEPIGVHDKMIELIKKRMYEKISWLHPKAKIVLVGRGSSDPLTQSDFIKIVSLLAWNLEREVIPAYMAVAKPSINEVWSNRLLESRVPIIIVPYLFFSGTLMNELEEKVKSLPSELQTDWTLCNTLGYDHLIASIFQEKLDEMQISPSFSHVQ